MCSYCTKGEGWGIDYANEVVQGRTEEKIKGDGGEGSDFNGRTKRRRQRDVLHSFFIRRAALAYCRGEELGRSLSALC